jgi:hypothetical protein
VTWLIYGSLSHFCLVHRIHDIAGLHSTIRTH